MKTLSTVQKEFKEKFGEACIEYIEPFKRSSLISHPDEMGEWFLSFISSSLRELLEQVVPERKENDKEHRGTNAQEHCESCIKNNGFNACRQEVEDRVKKILE